MQAKPDKGAPGQKKSVLAKIYSPNEVSRQGRSNHTLRKPAPSSETVGGVPVGETGPRGKRLTRQHRRRRVVDKKHDRLAVLCVASFIALLLIVSLSCLADVDTCSVETRLLFVSSDFKQPTNASLGQEIEILKNPNVLLLLAQRLGNKAGDCSASEYSRSGKGWDIEATSYEGGNSDQLAVPAEFSSSADFIRWISSNLAVDYNAIAGKATASLKLSGDDPNFLKAVMNSYVQCYADYRRSMEEELIPPAPQSNPHDACLDIVNDQLQKADMQYKECDLALKLIDSRPGVFSGFVPDSQMNGIPSLSHFQKRIVELEINKRQLNVKFTPNSREVKNLDSEIVQVKLAMRECLAEHMFFLKKNRELLLAQKQDFEKKAQAHSKPIKGPCSVKTPNGDSRFYVTRTLQVIQDSPNVYRKPLSVKADELKNSFFAFLSLPFNSAELRFLFGNHSEPFAVGSPGVSQQEATDSGADAIQNVSRLSPALDLFPKPDGRRS